jgi:hypothetical protein
MIADNELLFGQEAPLPEQVELRAGPISLIYEEGCIRYLRLGGKEILRRIYAAVRDHEWRTVPGTIRDVKIERCEDSFSISFTSAHSAWGIYYVWRGRIEGGSDGTITFDFDGEAKSAFKRNRIGFCVLHPIEAVVGAPCKAKHIDGSNLAPAFPKIVAQEQPVNGLRDLASLSYEALPGTWVTTEFSDDIFETEDQRNWTDDSFKTYCPPQSLPKPVKVEPGDRVHQRVVVRIEGMRAPFVPAKKVEPIRIVGVKKDLALPKIGFTARGEPIEFSATMRLQQLKPAHVRVCGSMNAPDWQQPFADGFREATALKTKVELALRLSGCPGEDLRDLITTFPEPFQHWAFSSSFARVLLSTYGEQSTSKRSLEAFRGFLLKTGLSTLDVPMGAGTEGDLYELNMQRPPRDADLFFWSMNPQTHAYDLASISETPVGAAVQVRSVHEYFGDAPLVVSPITLRPRSPALPDGTDPTIDTRQQSLFGAAWTVGMLAALTSSEAASATFFETTGPKGIMENGGPVYPMYHIFRAIAGATSAISFEISDPLAVAAIAVRLHQSVRTIIANYQRSDVEVAWLPGPESMVRRLNKETVRVALEQPDSFWTAASVASLGNGALQLAPFEIVFIDQPSLPDAF